MSDLHLPMYYDGFDLYGKLSMGRKLDTHYDAHVRLSNNTCSRAAPFPPNRLCTGNSSDDDIGLLHWVCWLLPFRKSGSVCAPTFLRHESFPGRELLLRWVYYKERNPPHPFFPSYDEPMLLPGFPPQDLLVAHLQILNLPVGDQVQRISTVLHCSALSCLMNHPPRRRSR